VKLVRKKLILMLALFMCGVLGWFAIYHHVLWPSGAFNVAYGSGSTSYSDGSLFRPIDVRLARQLLRGDRLFCIQLPQWQHRWRQWLVVDLEQQMFYRPNMPPDANGLNDQLGVAIISGKMEPGWKVDFTGGRALCFSPSGDWVLLTPRR